ncbi:hypothetical protein PR202_ga00105 [Eleusine coracana subsp. coracana]|uniref:Uncharacterized protein n=1 Tax=Eleusine coracana subsp. coracana TaxID=191504 RepID=A0AAV5BEC0_ELECO|nr:hypothetical protein PR202_ga00105 [Eleusine coracana subsp. coracana]
MYPAVKSAESQMLSSHVLVPSTDQQGRGRGKSSNERWTEQQKQFLLPSHEEDDMEAIPDVPFQVSEQGEAQDQTRGRQGNSGIQATEPKVLQPTSPRMQQPGSRSPANYGRLLPAAMAMASEAGDEDELTSYVQLDQVSYGVKREAFGPIYLVT